MSVGVDYYVPCNYKKSKAIGLKVIYKVYTGYYILYIDFFIFFHYKLSFLVIVFKFKFPFFIILGERV